MSDWVCGCVVECSDTKRARELKNAVPSRK